jgi:hypothetical protein
MYVQYIQGIADYALITLAQATTAVESLERLVRVNAAKFKPIIFFVSDFLFSNIANIFIFMILNNLCLLPA